MSSTRRALLKQLEHGPGSACALQLESQNPDRGRPSRTQSSPPQIYLQSSIDNYSSSNTYLCAVQCFNQVLDPSLADRPFHFRRLEKSPVLPHQSSTLPFRYHLTTPSTPPLAAHTLSVYLLQQSLTFTL